VRKPIIFLVEDNTDDEALTRRAIMKNNTQCEIVVAKDGVEALDYLLGDASETRIKPALILLDLKLPKVNGLDVLERIKKENRTRNIPVVILTSSKEELDLMKSYANGANSYITKPVDYSEFVSVVGIMTRYWLEVNVPPPH
jgi:two-component system, response regulator